MVCQCVKVLLGCCTLHMHRVAALHVSTILLWTAVVRSPPVRFFHTAPCACQWQHALSYTPVPQITGTLVHRIKQNSTFLVCEWVAIAAYSATGTHN